MLPTAHRLIGQEFIFQEENGHQHAGEKRDCKIVQNWIKENKITRLGWSAQSPGLNPIEHVWRDIKKRLAQSKSNSLTNLKENY